jgi:hypothetical protein
LAARETMSRADSDEAYVLAICDELLGERSPKQYRFDFLRGDPGRNGSCRKLPVDAYYQRLEIAIEYRELQHAKPVTHFDKTDRLTVSGVHRGEQRRRYDQRRRDVLPANGIRLIEIDCTDLACDKRSRLLRQPLQDGQVLESLLASHLPAGSKVPRS